jgi:hypothetical protein
MELTIMFFRKYYFYECNVLAYPLDKVWISFQTPHNLDLCDDTCKGNLTTNVQQTIDFFLLKKNKLWKKIYSFRIHCIGVLFEGHK